VPELAKAPGEPCVHATPAGCAIYEERPASCREFNCSWLLGLGDLSVRPDRVGVVLGGGSAGNMVFTRAGDGDRWQRSSFIRKQVRVTLKAGHRVAVISGEEAVEVKLR